MQKKTIADALHVLKKDARMKSLIATYPKPEYRRGKNAFQSLARAIIYQQLSGKAAATIFSRFTTIYGSVFPKPEGVLKTPPAALRAAGLSAQKTSYLKDLAAKFIDGTVNPKRFKTMTDAQVYEHVVQVKGIGPWTTDMFLMFTLGRPDILPTGDLGIQKGFKKLFNLRSLPTPERMQKLAAPWKPYRTIACWYLWRLADGNNNSR